MHVTVTPIFAALLGLIFFFLSLRTSLVRRRAKVSLGDGGDAGLQMAIRAHGNFIEYVPISLLLLAFLEMRTVSIYGVIVLGVLLVAGRCFHAIGISRQRQFPLAADRRGPVAACPADRQPVAALYLSHLRGGGENDCLAFFVADPGHACRLAG